MYFVRKSVALFFEQIGQQLALRRARFDKTKTPKRVFSFWFFVFILGQIGIITSLIWGGINGEGLVDALSKQGKSGNFLTFEISLILSCLVYYLAVSTSKCNTRSMLGGIGLNRSGFRGGHWV